jgi:FGFR1 oncogene partner
MDDLKQLVIQSLETNGVLGQVRAQLRSCVFKTIDNQDQVEQRRSSFHWENPLARKMREDSQACVATEIIREFMEFYRLDYSLAVFGPEANLSGKTENRADLASKVGLKSTPQKKPLLVHLIESFMAGDVSDTKAPSPQKIEAPRMPTLDSNFR